MVNGRLLVRRVSEVEKEGPRMEVLDLRMVVPEAGVFVLELHVTVLERCAAVLELGDEVIDGLESRKGTGVELHYV